VSTPMVVSQKQVLAPMLSLSAPDAAACIKRGLANDLPLVTAPTTMFGIGTVIHGLTDGTRDLIARIGIVPDIAYLRGEREQRTMVASNGGPAARADLGGLPRSRASAPLNKKGK